MAINASNQKQYIKDLLQSDNSGNMGISWTGNSGTAATIHYTYSLSGLNPIEPDSEIPSKSVITLDRSLIFRNVLTPWSSVANITFTEDTAYSSSLQQIVIAKANVSNDSGLQGATSVDKATQKLARAESYADNQYLSYGSGAGNFVLLHEIGHALGLDHPEHIQYSSNKQYSMSTSVESYTFGDYAKSDRFPETPMLYDIAAIQFLYGANFNYNKTDTNYELKGFSKFWTIWDGGGVDTLNASSQTSSVTLDLREGFDKDGKQYVTKVGNEIVFNAYHANIENAKGGSGDDYIYGNDKQDASGGYAAFSGVNKLEGGGGSDHLYGYGGNDILTGGTGDDFFVLNTGEGVDTITDPEADDYLVYNGLQIAGVAENIENGVYKLDGFILQKQGRNLFVTSNGKDSGVTIENFFPANYNTKTAYYNIGITIPKEYHTPDDVITLIRSPIVLDLNGDGLQYIAYDYLSGYNTHFDIDNDGFAEGMEWLDKNDGFLVRDLNGNGVIDNQKEMFGDDGGTTAYYKLAQLDTNNNSKIDADDAGFANLRIWQDLNSDARTQAGELKTLAALNIANLSLQLTNDALLNGHAVAGTSNFTRTNGTVGIAADVLLEMNNGDNLYVGTDTSVSPALDLSNLFLPLSRGHGTLLPLHYAMTQNPTLKTMVSDLVNLDIATQMHEVYDRVNAIILEWAGATNIIPIGQDINRNAAKLAVLQKYYDTDADHIYNVDQTYSAVLFDVLTKLLAQGPLRDIFPLVDYHYEVNWLDLGKTGIFDLGMTHQEMLERAKIYAPTNVADKAIYWDVILHILGTSTYDKADISEVEAAAGFRLHGFYKVITGSSDNDILTFGDVFGNEFQGLKGDDTFHIGAETISNIYYNLGDGDDTIILDQPLEQYYGNINFGPGITFDSLSFQLNSAPNVGNVEKMLISIQGGGSINIDSPDYLFKMNFADGDIKGYSDINYKIYGGIGTAGDDVLYGTSKDVLMNGFAGNDYMRGDIGNDTIYGGDGNDFISGAEGNDKIYGDAGDDLLVGDIGSDVIDGGDGIDTIQYLGNGEGVNVNLALTTAQSGGDAAGDILFNIENIIGSNYSDILTGNSGDNVISGGVGADKIDGGAGNDTVTYYGWDAITVNLALTTEQISLGDAYRDILINIENIIGSNSNDTLIGNSSDNIINGGAGADIIDGGAGSDTVSYEGMYGGAVKVNLSLTTAQTGGYAQGDILTSIENIIGSNYNDTLTGNNANNTLSGGAGNDTLIGGLGADKIDGGLGIDIASYSASAAAVNVNLTLTTAQSGGDAAGDILTNIENLTGSAFSDTLTGNSSNNIIIGGVGNDTLIGRLGADTLDGGTGNDTASYSASTTAVTVNLSLTTAQSGGEATGDILSNIENVIGSSYNDTLIALAAGSTLTGGAGNDKLTGGIGSDILIGGLGADTMNGGAGIDTVSYTTSTTGVTVDLNLTTAQINGDAAGDLLSSIENVIGSAFNDNLIALATGSTLTGGAGNDILTGGIGKDTLIGGLGADTINGGAGIDTVSYTTSTAGVTVDLNLTTAQINGDAAGDLLSNIENITGSAFSDVLTGNIIANIINGGDGNDYIYSRDGNDTVSGGNGDDTIDAGIGNDTVHGDAGNDTIYGYDGDDILYGDAGNDIIWGEAGNNTLIGGAGTDTLYGFSGVSTASYSTSTAAVNINLATNVNTGGDAAGDLLYGINSIIGSSFADTLTGGTGKDTLMGGSGKDTLTGGAGADIFKYSATTDSGAAAGVRDIITDFVNGTDKIDLSAFTGDFVFKGTGAFTGTAHEVNYAQVGGNTILGIDADGNGILDFQIELTGLHTMATGDFLL